MEDRVRTRAGRIAGAVADVPVFSKLIIIYAIVILVPTLGVAFIAAGSVRSSVTREVEESNRQTVRQVASNINARVDVARSVAESIAYSTRVRSFLTQRFSMTPYALNVYMNQVALLVNNALSFHTGSLYKATVYMQNATIPEHWRMFLHASRLADVDWYREFIESGKTETHVYPNTADHVLLGQNPDLRPVVTWISRIDTVDGRYLGLVSLDMLETELFFPLFEASDADRRFVVVDAYDRVVYSPTGRPVSEPPPGSLTITEPIQHLGLSVRADLPMTYLTQRTARASWSMILSSILGFFLSVALMYGLLKVLFSKVNGMIAAMHTVAEGDLSVRVPIGSNDELGQLAHDFNYLIERINTLVQRVVIEEREKQEAQLAALQYQINPHFIYNTIDLFRMQLELDGRYETADAITSFGKMVRYTMAGDSVYATIASELEHVRHFVALQKIRYEERVSLKIECAPELADLRIMKLTLQPIVENCVMHGIHPDGASLSVVVKIAQKKNTVTVTISDDGIGIPTTRLRALRRALSAKDVNFFSRNKTDTGIGLANIVGRLRLFYGEAGKFRIGSEPGNGTIVTISFPAAPTDKSQASAS
ncbi:MAG: sensor histidine kinase [Spirochaetaceae bacterium]|nr:MAG: sensor histidine kinase [Spirochaetaceae bacterium]